MMATYHDSPLLALKHISASVTPNNKGKTSGIKHYKTKSDPYRNPSMGGDFGVANGFNNVPA